MIFFSQIIFNMVHFTEFLIYFHLIEAHTKLVEFHSITALLNLFPIQFSQNVFCGEYLIAMKGAFDFHHQLNCCN